ncbi:hypothetical protein Aple_098630 [Acrocarpospora pleiomorpha]|uniref:Uncharacterized protein n=1 Tax=Acrocarpospora pleiomorpha TaxID=90975 RepID=A0A5M3Y0U9_9ACTN|nr:hypothetical protein Aple_098630 [Acrocarpospora pleiomorpha]
MMRQAHRIPRLHEGHALASEGEVSGRKSSHVAASRLGHLFDRLDLRARVEVAEELGRGVARDVVVQGLRGLSREYQAQAVLAAWEASATVLRVQAVVDDGGGKSVPRP